MVVLLRFIQTQFSLHEHANAIPQDLAAVFYLTSFATARVTGDRSEVSFLTSTRLPDVLGSRGRGDAWTNHTSKW